jgi:hypothetical protein
MQQDHIWDSMYRQCFYRMDLKEGRKSHACGVLTNFTRPPPSPLVSDGPTPDNRPLLFSRFPVGSYGTKRRRGTVSLQAMLSGKRVPHTAWSKRIPHTAHVGKRLGPAMRSDAIQFAGPSRLPTCALMRRSVVLQRRSAMRRRQGHPITGMRTARSSPGAFRLALGRACATVHHRMPSGRIW